jgi:hypothetical protein
MNSKYKFDDIQGKGYCKIKYEFHKSGDNEFETRVETLILEDKKQDKNKLEKIISNMADKLKLLKYKEIKKETKENV